MIGRPVKVIGDKAFVDVIDAVVGAVGRHLRAVAAVEEKTAVAATDAVHEPVQAFQDSIAGGAVVEDGAVDAVAHAKVAFLHAHNAGQAKDADERIRLVVAHPPASLAHVLVQREQTPQVRLAAQYPLPYKQQVVVALARTVRKKKPFTKPIHAAGFVHTLVASDGLAQTLGQVGMTIRPVENSLQ